MKWPTRMKRLAQIDTELREFSKNRRNLPGIADAEARNALAMQMVASLRRLDYTAALRARPADPSRADPNNAMFDPERAAIFHQRQGNFDEAVWLLFLASHFGKHRVHGWRRLQDVYSGLGTRVWTWQAVTQDPDSFLEWLATHWRQIGGAFGNHRKYESLRPDSSAWTGNVIKSYLAWIGPSHDTKFSQLVRSTGNNPHSIFDAFYYDMDVLRFGRLGKFDFLCLIGRHDLAPISPGSAFLAAATGPLSGARLLVGGTSNAPIAAPDLEKTLQELDATLNVGMQVMEDALCNWQKSPLKFKHFIG